MKHGIDCLKIDHKGLNYSHGKYFDGLFVAGNKTYCGRCHMEMIEFELKDLNLKKETD